MARRRRGGPEGLTTIYWRDIPAQITATIGGTTAKTMLEPRFQHAIDRAAAVADLTETEAYIAQWRRANEPVDGLADELASAGDLDALVQTRAADVDRRYPRDRLEQLVASGGADTSPAGDGQHPADRNADHQTRDEESER